MPATDEQVNAALRTIDEMSAEQLRRVREHYNGRTAELARFAARRWQTRQQVEFTDRAGRVIHGIIKTVNDKTATLEGCRESVFRGGSIARYPQGVRVPFSLLRPVVVPPAPGSSIEAATLATVGPQDGDEDRL